MSYTTHLPFVWKLHKKGRIAQPKETSAYKMLVVERTWRTEKEWDDNIKMVSRKTGCED